ncbi:MAG: GNAT family N-acetyltransferase [Porticoccaceae bacterium]|nr:GNAT family N-acetyltransferase [Porticoccaceae bacterium]
MMKYLPAPLSEIESDAMANKCRSLISNLGWGFWATEVKATGEFIGLVGLNTCKPSLPFSPCVEVGWRLAKQHWGNGYATEGATEALRFAFNTLELGQVVAFTVPGNNRSWAVMERIGMSNTGQNFLHPDLPEDHHLSEHVLYRVTREDWQRFIGRQGQEYPAPSGNVRA